MIHLPDCDMNLFSYPLPDDRIARYPLSRRDACRLLLCSSKGLLSDRIFSELPEILPPNSLLVRNNTKVINARLRFTKETGAEIEIFCLEPLSPLLYEEALSARHSCTWKCLVGNSKRWKQGDLQMEVTTPSGEKILFTASREYPQDKVTFTWNVPGFTFGEILELIGQLPIPPYLHRDTQESDRDDYQTTYAQKEGSVAAPTAGLHFTSDLDQRLQACGHSIEQLTLHVGAGTFLPVKSSHIAQHEMHQEVCIVSKKTIERLLDQEERNQEIVAVGTTSVRTLESLYWLGLSLLTSKVSAPLPYLEQWTPYAEYTEYPSRKEMLRFWLRFLEEKEWEHLSFSTSLLIAPPYQYRMVDAIITNFHQPHSTLLLLIAAFLGEQWRALYHHALENNYRFLSYGDACFLQLPHRSNASK